MPAKKKAVKKTVDEQQNKKIAMQGMVLAILAGIVLFSLIRMAQFRDEVDARLMQELATPVQQLEPVAK
jgi:hypothetical protein